MEKGDKRLIPPSRAVAFLFHLGQEFRAILDPPTLLDRLLRLLHDVGGCQNCALLLPSENGQWSVAAALGSHPQEVGRKYASLPSEVARGLYLIPQVAQDPWASEAGLLWEGPLLLAPLSIEGKLLGVLLLESSEASVFSAEDRETLEAILPHLTAAIDVALLHQQAVMAARYDSLTGAHSRSFLQERLEAELALCRFRGLSFSLAIIDLDGLKGMNDRYGHLAGDESLSLTGHIISQNMRDTDMVARYGGDEFVILMSNTSWAQAEKVMERLMRLLDNTTVDIQGQSLPLPSRRFGIATFPQDGNSPAELLAAADRLLYKAKSERKGP